MSPFQTEEQKRLDRVGHVLRIAPRLTAALFSKVVMGAGTRSAEPSRARHAERLAHLVVAEAWIDASLLLIERELPGWHLRRLISDGGEWMCSLSRHPCIPVEMDVAADGRHGIIPIAILLSFVAAKALTTTDELALNVSVPKVKPAFGYPVCCDDFG